jgi:hypothetical protein
MQPSISTFPSTVAKNTSYTLTGSRFKGYTQGDSGFCYYGSATNYPRVYLQFMDSGNHCYAGPSGRLIDVSTSEYPIADWQNADTSISFTTPADLPAGYYLLTVVANAVPSDAKIIKYELPTSAYTTKVGSARSWQWGQSSGDNVPSGASDDWQWRLWEPGSGRKVPQGTAATWEWGNE